MTSIVERIAALAIGTVESVAPNEIRIILDVDAPQTTALNTGIPTGFPRVNGYILIPNETGAVVGLVTGLGVERSAFPKRTGLKDYGLIDLPFPLRKLTLTPVGTLGVARLADGRQGYRLVRGVSVFPSVGDSALLPTPDQAAAIVASEGSDRRVVIGTAPLAADAPISVDPDKVFGRHIAVLGNTGSGKSCSVAGLIRWSLESARSASKGKSPNARFIILDPNGEYAKAFRDIEPPPRVFRVPPLDDGAQALEIPAWMWNSREWLAFTSAAPGTQGPLLLQALRELRSSSALSDPATVRVRRLLLTAKRGLEARVAQGYSGYSGVPGKFDTGGSFRNIATDSLRYSSEFDAELKERLEGVAKICADAADARAWKTRDGGEGFNDFSESDLLAVIGSLEGVLALLPPSKDIVGPNEDAPVPFDIPEISDHVENLAAHAGAGNQVAPLVMRIRMLLADGRLGPLILSTALELDSWLGDYIGQANAANGPISIIDLSLVPPDVVHLVISVIARVIFEAIQRYRNLHGEVIPTALILEEAHTFVHRSSDETDDMRTAGEVCRLTFERIAREGRKFGLGLVLSSQRPSELSQTVLAQCNTFLLHRIVNDRDQQLVQRLVPDTLAGLLSELPSLPARQAILLGWATPIPVLVELRRLPKEHQPESSDPSFWDVWTGAVERPVDWKPIADVWQAKDGAAVPVAPAKQIEATDAASQASQALVDEDDALVVPDETTTGAEVDDEDFDSDED